MNQCEVIAVGNQKGGVAKSTVSTHLAVAFGERGKKVLVWDLDSNSGTTNIFKLPKSYLGSLEVMTGEEDPADVILSNSPDDEIYLPNNVDVIISRRNIETLELAIRAKNHFVDARDSLKKPIQSLLGRYDYIILDTAPNTGVATMAAYKAARWFLLSASPSPLAIQGLNEALRDIGKVKEYGNPDLELLGVVLSCVDTRTNLSRKLVNHVQEVFPPESGPFNTQISRAVAVEEGQVVGKTVLQSNPTHKVSEQFRLLATEVEQRIFHRKNKSMLGAVQNA